MGKRGSMFLNMLLIVWGVNAGHSAAWGGESWLLGFGFRVDAAIELVHKGVRNPTAISNEQLETSIVELGNVTDQLEVKLDHCLSSPKEQKICRVENNKKAVEVFRRKILNTRALVVFFRNLMIMEFNKPTSERDFSLAHRLGAKIRRFT